MEIKCFKRQIKLEFAARKGSVSGETTVSAGNVILWVVLAAIALGAAVSYFGFQNFPQLSVLSDFSGGAVK
jgi:hypothetical protein